MARLDDLDQYFDPGLILTVGGKEYAVPAPSAELGLWCQQMTRLAGAIKAATTEAEMHAIVERIQAAEPDDGHGDSLAQRLLGQAWHEMAADDIGHQRIEFCGKTVYVWIVGGEEKAAEFWRSGGRPEAVSPTPNRAERRAAAKPRRTATAGAGATRTRASTSGTNSRPTTAASVPARRSRGARSSTPGPR